MVSMGRLYVGSCPLVETSRLCVRRAGSDLNPNHLSVSVSPSEMDSFAVTSPTFRLANESLPVYVSESPRGRCAKGRIEVREHQLELRCHVPVGVLKFSKQNHVGTSSVQQTLDIMDSFTKTVDAGSGDIW